MVRRVRRVESGMDYGDGKAFGIEYVGQLKHRAYVALIGQREKNQSPPTFDLLHTTSLSWDLHGAFACTGTSDQYVQDGINRINCFC